MKIQNLEYILEIAQLGSISKAGERYGLSQPNLSGILKSAEDELGYQIFYRTNRGIEVTEKGNLFLAFARNTVNDYKKMTSEINGKAYHRLNISSCYLYFVEEVFQTFCSKYSSTSADYLSLTIDNTSAETIVENVYLNKSDMGMILIPKAALDSFTQLCKRKELKVSIIDDFNYYIHLRTEHPLLEDDSPILSKLADYPCVEFARNTTTAELDIEYLKYVNPDKYIHVDDRDTRYRIVGSSNAYSIGIGLYPSMREKYNIQSIQLNNICYDLVCIQKAAIFETKEIKEFKNILKQTIAKIEEYDNIPHMTAQV